MGLIPASSQRALPNCLAEAIGERHPFKERFALAPGLYLTPPGENAAALHDPAYRAGMVAYDRAVATIVDPIRKSDDIGRDSREQSGRFAGAGQRLAFSSSAALTVFSASTSP